MVKLSRSQASGGSLAVGAALFGVGGAMHATQPADLAAFLAVDQTIWAASHWLLVLAAALVGAGLVGMAVQLGEGGEGLSLIGGSVGLIGAAGVVGVVAPEAVGFPILAQSPADPASIHAFVAITANMTGMATAFGTLLWLGAGILFVSALADERWPRWLGITGVIVAIAQIASIFVAAPPVVALTVSLIGAAMLLAAGVRLARMSPRRSPFMPAPTEIRRAAEQDQPV